MSSNSEQAFHDRLQSFQQSRQQAAGSSSSTGPSAWLGTLRNSVGIGSSTGYEAQTSSSGWSRWWPNSMTSEDPSSACFGMSRIQRMVAFVVVSLASALCFLLAFTTLFVAILKPQKFALLFTAGSLLSMSSFTFLHGWRSMAQQMLATDRLPYTVVYVGSMMSTLYAVLVVQSYFLTVALIVVQLVSVVWYYVSFLPGGTSALQAMARGIRGLLWRQPYLPI